MFDGLLQEITIYHKGTEIEKHNKNASVRNTSYLNRNKTGLDTVDTGIIRIFDVEGYETTWKCNKGDVIVSFKVDDIITEAPLTYLRKKYGKENVFEVSSIDKFIFEEEDLKELNHIKVGVR